MLQQGLKTAYYHSFMHIDHYLKDADQWQCHKYYEKKLFSQLQKPSTYIRYVDNMFAIFNHEAVADEFLNKLN